MAKVGPITGFGAGIPTAVDLNTRFEEIIDAFTNTLSRDGSAPNQMLTNLDMNEQRILNLPRGLTNGEPLRVGDVNVSSIVGTITNNTITLRSVTILRALNGVSTMQPLATTALVQGYATYADGGGATYYLDPTDTTSADDDSTIIVDAGGGRWKRQPGTGRVQQVSRTTIYEFISGNQIPAMLAGGSSYDARLAVQKLIDAGCKEIYHPEGTVPVSLNPASPALAGVFGASGVALQPTSGLKIYGKGTIQLLAGQGATSGAIFGNPTAAACDDFELEGIAIDVNKTNTTGTICAAVIVDSRRPIYRNVRALNASFFALGFRRFAGVGGGNYGVQDGRIEGCYVNVTGDEGIQVSRPDGIIIAKNTLRGVGSNGIDIEANDVANSTDNSGFAKLIYCEGNEIITPGNVGYFIESCGPFTILGGFVQDPANNVGIYCNRINSGALYGLIRGVQVRLSIPATVGSGKYGLQVVNSSGRILVDGNYFDGWDCSIFSSSAFNLAIGRNYHRKVARYCVGWANSANQLVESHVADQALEDPAIATTRYPYICPPTRSPKYAASVFNAKVDSTTCLNQGVSILPSYQIGRATLLTNSAWGGFSLLSGGQTFILPGAPITGTTDQTTQLTTIGQFAIINGHTYLAAGITAGAIQVQQWNGSAYVDGDFTAVLNAAYLIEVFSPQFGV